ncbi:hypothetical protein VVR12_01420 [Rothia sp. LK2588]|uniref:hypothetical protein n=1 Tax=Rothia sp. LK2588 TaxID=3114369 RepID=UPI0034CE20C0
MNPHEESSAVDDQLATSWSRISLDFGPDGFTADDEAGEPAEDSTQSVVRVEIENMINAIKRAAEESGDRENNGRGLADLDVTAEQLEKMLGQRVADDDSVPDSERGSDEGPLEGDAVLKPRLEDDTMVVDLATSPLLNQDAGDDDDNSSTDTHATDEDDHDDQDEQADLDRRAREATSNDVVEALMLAAVKLPEVLVYEADDHHVDVFVLCVNHHDEVLTAHLGENGKLHPGDAFEEFAAELMGQLPVRGGLCANEDSYLLSAPVTALGEELVLDADAYVAAYLQVPFEQLRQAVHTSDLMGPVDAAPVDDNAVLLTAPAAILLPLLSELRCAAVVTEVTEFNQHLAFVVPDSFDHITEQVAIEGIGSPDPEPSAAGTVIDLTWGAPKTLTRYLPQNSYAVDTLWLLPGNLPEPLNFVRMTDELENLSWVFGLNDSATKRLHNYVEDSASELGMESVLQLLDMPGELAKLSSETIEIESLENHEVLYPAAATYEDPLEGLGEIPPHALQAVRQQVQRRPWLMTLDGVAQLSVSGALAIFAARRRAQGLSARPATVGAAALLGTGLAELALSRTYIKVQEALGKQRNEPAHNTSRDGSLMDELASPEKPNGGLKHRADSSEKRAFKRATEFMKKLGSRNRKNH